MENGAKETSRIEGFSDGVFAISITLLILELIPILHEPTEDRLLRHLLNHWEAFLAFGMGFLTILICWINHHLVFTYIHKVDSNLMWVNGFVLLVVSFTPFPTAILSQYLLKEGHMALAVFGFNYIMMSMAAYFISAYTYKRKLIKEDSTERYYSFVLIYKYSLVYNTFVFFVCFLSVPLAIFFYILLFVAFAFPREFAARILKMKQRRKLR